MIEQTVRAWTSLVVKVSNLKNIVRASVLTTKHSGLYCRFSSSRTQPYSHRCSFRACLFSRDNVQALLRPARVVHGACAAAQNSLGRGHAPRRGDGPNEDPASSFTAKCCTGRVDCVCDLSLLRAVCLRWPLVARGC